MRRAVDLAHLGQGYVEPNPMVGCVLAKKDLIIGEGYHRRFGGPHAEVEAISSARSNTRRCTAYVTLEPCCHTGKTGPCVRALLDAGVKRVIAAVRDPNPSVAGKGIKQLKAAGVETNTGLLETDCRALMAPYLKLAETGRPYVILKWAQSLDGKLATRTGDSKWISNKHSRLRVHELRALMDAVLVGINTILADDPRLNARGVTLRRKSAAVVLDSNLRIPATCKLAKSARSRRVIVYCQKKMAKSRSADQLRELGVEVVGMTNRGKQSGLVTILEDLGRRNMTNVLVEGGGKILNSFLAANLADEAYVYVSSLLIGGGGVPVCSSAYTTGPIKDCLKPQSVHLEQIENDVCWHLRLSKRSIGLSA